MRVAGFRTVLPLIVLLGGVVLVVPALLGNRPRSLLPVPGSVPEPGTEESRPSPVPDAPPPLPASLSGLVTGDPEPLSAGAWVQVTGGGESLRALLDGDGRFLFRQVPPGRPLELWLGPDPSGSRICRLAEGLILRPSERRDLVLVAPTEAAIRGTVRDAAGNPLPGVRLAALPPAADWREEGVAIAGETDPGGRFFIGLAAGVRPDALRIVVDAVDRGYCIEERVVDPRGAEAADLVVRLETGLVIAGRALGPDGRALPDATVHLLEDYRGDPGLRRPVEGRVTTDAEGRFRDDALRPGVYWLHLTGEREGRSFAVAVRGVAAGDEEVTVRFPGFGCLAARFENAVTGAPVLADDVEVQFIWGHDGEAEEQVPWGEGEGREVEFPGLPEGHYRLRIAASGYEVLLTDLLWVQAGGRLGPLLFSLRPL